MSHTLTLRSVRPVTHDTSKLVFDRPDGYTFSPGQACEMNLCKDGWQDEKRPFTFTSDPGDDALEFVIKSYPDHDGVTRQIAQIAPGDQVQIGDPWGAIADKGPGVFIAGGAGITPFIPILRQRDQDDGAKGCTLIFANAARRDIILHDEWERMAGLTTHYPLSEERAEGHPHGQIDSEMLDTLVTDFDQTFYVCGPKPMEKAMSDLLMSRGVPEDRIVTEDH